MLNAARLSERAQTRVRFAEKEIDGDNYRCRILKLSERDRFQLGMLDEKTGKPSISNLEGGKARLLEMCLVDEEGKRVAKAEDFEEAFSPVEIDKIHEWVQEVNGMNPKAAEEAAGNS